MDTDFYKYHGPTPEETYLERRFQDEINYLPERMADTQSLRVLDREGNLRLDKTYHLMLLNVQDMPVKRGFRYVLNIEKPDKPRIEIVSCSQELDSKYKTLEMFREFEKKDSLPKIKKRRFGKMLFGRATE